MENKPIAIFLDDERQIEYINDRININEYKWIVIRNYFDFVEFVDLNYEKINIVSFDHDIDSFDEDGIEWTGRDAARYLQSVCQDNNKLFPDFLVHSMNTVGKTNIISDIKNYIHKYERRGNWENWRYFHTGFVNGKFI